MSYKCGECGLVNWSGESSCKSCGAALSPELPNATYAAASQMKAEQEEERASRTRLRPFFKGLLVSVGLEFIVLFFTAKAFASSMMRHSANAPRPASEDFLAQICFIYHLPSLLLLTPLNLFLLAPLVQIALMTLILRLVFRARES